LEGVCYNPHKLFLRVWRGVLQPTLNLIEGLEGVLQFKQQY